jgi:hypothetical protein
VTNLTASQTFYFVVSAYSGQPSCESINSSEVSALSCLATAPTALAATPDAAGHVALTWAPPSGGAVSYSVSRSTTSGSGYTVVASGLSTTSYTDSPAVPTSGTATYYYVVWSNTGNCNSPHSPHAPAVAAPARADAGNCIQELQSSGYSVGTDASIAACSACKDNGGGSLESNCKKMIDCLQPLWPCAQDADCWVNCRNSAAGSSVLDSCVVNLTSAACGAR